MAVDFPEKVSFKDHRILQASDLEEQRDFHIQRRWQHNLAMHSWGILCGLTINCEGIDPQRPSLEVRPGMALDGYGREIILTKSLSALRTNQLLDPGLSYDVWIRFREIHDEIDDTLDDDCEGELGTMQRIHDEPEVFVRTTSKRQSGSVKTPSDVPIEDLGFTASQAMKFDSDILWPVFLGRIERINAVWTLDETERYYGGLIAQRIEFPNDMREPTREANKPDTKLFGRTMIINGGDPTDKKLRFAVVELAVDTETSGLDDIAKRNKPFSIRQEEASTQIHLNADRIVAEGHLQFKDGAGIELQPRAVTETTKRTIGWGIFSELQVPSKQNEPFGNVLEFAMPADEDGTNHITFGATNSDGEFKKILSINSDQSVDIFGTLRVHGAIAGTNSEIPFQPGLLSKDDIDETAKFVKSLTTEQQRNVVTGVADGAAVDTVTTGLELSKNKKVIYPQLTKNILETIDSSQQQDVIGQCATIVAPQDFVDGLNKVQTVTTDLVKKLLHFSFVKSVAADIVEETIANLSNLSKIHKAKLVQEIAKLDADDFAVALIGVINLTAVVKLLANAQPADFLKGLQDADSSARKTITQKLAEKSPGGFVTAFLSSDKAKEVVSEIAKQLNVDAITAVVAGMKHEDFFDGFKQIAIEKRKPILKSVLNSNDSGLAETIPDTGSDDLKELAQSITGANKEAILRLAAEINSPTP